MVKTVILRVVSISVFMLVVNGNRQADGIQSYDRNTVSEQFCTGETFRPRCPEGKSDVIVMLSAHYGRMSFGRCIEEDPEFESMKNNPKFIGCSSDVKYILDQQCFGLSECDVRIPNQHFEGIKPCLPGLQVYLEASYACIQVAAENRHCSVPLTTEPQHLVVVVGSNRTRLSQADTGRCGTGSQPWSIEALPGQRIAVSLIQFGRSLDLLLARNSSNRLSSGCRTIYGFVIDKHSRLNVTICGDRHSEHGGKLDASTQSTIHVSRANSLQIFTNNNIAYNFIIRIEVVGCSDLAPPSDDAYLKRVDDQLTIRCYTSRQSWQLDCINGVWTGSVGVCSSINEDEHTSDDVGLSMQRGSIYDRSTPNTELAALVAVASSGVALCCLVIFVGVLCLRRQQRGHGENCDQNADAMIHIAGDPRSRTGLSMSSTSPCL